MHDNDDRKRTRRAELPTEAARSKLNWEPSHMATFCRFLPISGRYGDAVRISAPLLFDGVDQLLKHAVKGEIIARGVDHGQILLADGDPGRYHAKLSAERSSPGR